MVDGACIDEPHELLLRIYERAREQLLALDTAVFEQLKHMATPKGDVTHVIHPGLRDLAYLEGLRSERDRAREDASTAEAKLVDHVLRGAGLQPNATD